MKIGLAMSLPGRAVQLRVHAIPLLLAVLRGDALLLGLTVPLLLGEVGPVEGAGALHAEPGTDAGEVEEVGRVAGEKDDEGVGVVEEGCAADGAHLVGGEGRGGDTLQHC